MPSNIAVQKLKIISSTSHANPLSTMPSNTAVQKLKIISSITSDTVIHSAPGRTLAYVLLKQIKFRLIFISY